LISAGWISRRASYRTSTYCGNPGYNVAYWNCSSARSRNGDGQITANGEPLRFFHFSGFSPEDPDELSRHGNRTGLDGQPLVRSLCRDYASKLNEHGYQSARDWEYGFARLPNGPELSGSLRQRYRKALAAREMDGSIFSEDGASRFRELLARDHPWGSTSSATSNQRWESERWGRQMVSALTAGEVPRAAISLPSLSRQGHAFKADAIGDARHPIHLICANADVMVALAAELGSILHDRYSVGFWWWEGRDIPLPPEAGVLLPRRDLGRIGARAPCGRGGLAHSRQEDHDPGRAGGAVFRRQGEPRAAGWIPVPLRLRLPE